MIDRPSGGERVVLVHINFPAGGMEESFDEFKELAVSAGADIAQVITGTRRVPDARYFVGAGKAEEIGLAVAECKAQLVIFNHVLTPAQERNLERLISCRVIDRTGLILDIFAQRARSFEGKLQVELAQLNHLSTRLVRGWTHLERQRGGIGVRGGPGETQLETDRRLIRNKIKLISVRLDKLRKQRELGRRARRKAVVPTIALVGYTNAGKSTLFNRLTGASVYAANQLFATLDPTLRRTDFKEIGSVIFADTVGFIRHLPHDLVDAFHATLEEVIEADLLLHVIDNYNEQKKLQIEQVNEVLENIGAKEVPTLLVYNKSDLGEQERFLSRPRLERDERLRPKRVFVSANTGEGIPELLQAISEMLGRNYVEREVILTHNQGKLRAELYSLGAVLSETITENGEYCLQVRLAKVELEKLFG